MPHPLGLVYKGCGFRVNFMHRVSHAANHWQQNRPNSFSASFTGNNRPVAQTYLNR